MPNHIPVKYRLLSRRIVDENSGCWLWQGSKDSSGYGSINVRGKIVSSHRHSYQEFVGPIPDSMQVLHRCDTPACFNPDHLFLGTHAENMRDRERKGRAGHKRGADRLFAKLNDEKVRNIRADDRPYSEIMKEYGISHGLVSMVKTRKMWKHVE
jgi:hypothetical protein